MNNREDISHGSADALREFIFDTLRGAEDQGYLGQIYAANRDDAALEYTVLRLVGYTRAAIATLADLKKMNEEARNGDGPQ
jgi:hypothetical protein